MLEIEELFVKEGEEPRRLGFFEFDTPTTPLDWLTGLLREDDGRAYEVLSLSLDSNGGQVRIQWTTPVELGWEQKVYSGPPALILPFVQAALAHKAKWLS